MKDRTIVIACVAFGLLVVGLAWWSTPGRRPGRDGKDEATPSEPPKEVETGRSVTSHDVDRLPTTKRRWRSLVEVAGRGAQAKNGVSYGGDFYYVATVTCESLVTSRSVTPLGEVKVVETRRYDLCNDQLTFGDFDVKLALDTIPIRQAAPYVASVTKVVGWMGASVATAMGAPVIGATIGTNVSLAVESVEKGIDYLYRYDGTSLKKTLCLLTGFFGKDVPKTAGEWLDKICKEQVAPRTFADVKSAAQAVSGRDYVVTYFQSASGEKMRLHFERADRTPLTDQEYRILRELNVFLCCHVVPTHGPAVGESWDISVGELPGMFDSLAGGSGISGVLKAKRLPDEPNGDQMIDIGGGRVAALDDVSGMEKGSFQITKGSALVTPDAAHEIRAFGMNGRGKLRLESVSKRLSLFKFLSRVEGDCDMRVTLTSESVD